jgi:hypothetical protein
LHLFEYTQISFHMYFFLNRRIEYDLRSPGNTTQSPLISTRSPELRHRQIRKDSISSDLSILTTDSDGII